jgi:hypothetical protein
MAGTQAAASSAAGPTGPTKEQLMARIQELTGQLNEAGEQIVAANERLAMKIRIKDPDVYNGERAKLENFLQELDIYFTARQGMDDVGKVLFTASYFRETAASWFRPYMAGYTKNGGIEYPEIFGSYERFKSTLRSFFGDSDRQAALERKILAMTQKGSASDYVAHLQRLMMEANWRDDKTNMAIMLRGLKPEVQYETVKEDPDGFKEAATIAVKVDNQLYNLKQLRKHGHWNQYGASHKKSNWKAKRRHPDEMDIDNVNLKPKVDWKKKSQKKGKCFNCGKEGHFARECFKEKKPTEKRIEFRTTRLREIREVPETPPRRDSPTNEATKIEEATTLFYTPEELELYGMTPEQEGMLDRWIEEELSSFRDTTTPGHRGLGWWQCCEATQGQEMCARHHHEHEQATHHECWTKYWRNAKNWECDLHPIPSTIEFEGKEYLLCQKANGRLATPIFCDRPNISSEIRLVQEDPSEWYPEWKVKRIDIYAPGMRPMEPQTTEDILDGMTDSDLVSDEEWVQMEPPNSPAPGHQRMEIRTTNLRQGLGRGGGYHGGEQPPAYASRIDVSRTDDLEEPLRIAVRAQTDTIVSQGETIRDLMREESELQKKIERLATEVEVMTITADDWQTKANTVEARLRKRIAELEARVEQQLARLDKTERTVQGLSDMIRWEIEYDMLSYERIDDALREQMRATKVDDFIGLWRELVAEEAERKAKTGYSGNDRAMRK